jgi:oxygen-independent coproporphyrinogen III oxidase
MTSLSLVRKYNVPGPRYTSYPTVPFWNSTAPTSKNWQESISSIFDETNGTEGISLYIHLPYCESLCTYCGCNTRITVNHAVEIPYIEAVLKEWSMYLTIFPAQPIVREIHLGGGTPTFFKPENLSMLINGILEKSKRHDDFEFSIEGHPNNTTEAHLETLAKLGFKRISYGIQDFDPIVQNIINRVQPIENVIAATDLARKHGFTSINYDLVYGLPKQTLEGIIDTINQVIRLRPDRIAFYSYAHVPWLKPGQRKFTEADLPDDETKRNLYETGREMLEAAGYKEVGMDHFALVEDALYKAAEAKNLHRNFMGYTTTSTHLLIGLGVSSISDSWTCFVQNEKTVDDYFYALAEGRLPFFKGHSLNTEDLVIRRFILDLMCHFEASWEPDSAFSSYFDNGAKQLNEMVTDGLVEIFDHRIVVTAAGRPFVRNICMIFDSRLMKNAPEKQIFSKTI